MSPVIDNQSEQSGYVPIYCVANRMHPQTKTLQTGIAQRQGQLKKLMIKLYIKVHKLIFI